MNRLVVLFIALIVLNSGSKAQAPAENLTVESLCLSNAEVKLGALINEYRKTKKLPPIPLSASLCYVARLHVQDLETTFKAGTRCNLHSWSENPAWSSCCYTEDHKRAECMWDKPRELTGYKGDGYEIAYFSNYDYSSDEEFVKDALKGWQSSRGHNEIIINAGKWLTAEWKAMGVAVYGDYTVVWFGEISDPAGRPARCQY